MKTLLDIHTVRINGNDVALGRCPLCGRNVTRSMINKTGARCKYEGAQFNRAGTLLYCGARGKPWNSIALANEFSKLLRAEIGDVKLAQVIARNKRKSKGVCHSHDFCDANMVMLVAWNKIVAKRLGPTSEAQTLLWNEAWDIAKHNQFFYESFDCT